MTGWSSANRAGRARGPSAAAPANSRIARHATLTGVLPLGIITALRGIDETRTNDPLLFFAGCSVSYRRAAGALPSRVSGLLRYTAQRRDHHDGNGHRSAVAQPSRLHHVRSQGRQGRHGVVVGRDVLADLDDRRARM